MNTPLSAAPRIGIPFMLAGMFLISTNDMLVKLLSGDYPLHQLVLMRSLVAIVVTGVMLQMEGGFKLMRTDRVGLHVLRALLIVFANTALYCAIVVMPLATATAIYFVSPLFVTLLSIPVLGEVVGRRRFAAIGLGFVGVLIMMGPELARGEAGFGWIMVLPVLAAAGYASMSVLTRKLGSTSRASALAMNLQLAFVVISLGVWAVAGDGRYAQGVESESWQFLFRVWVWPARADLVPIVGLGVMSALIGYLMTQAYRLSRASVVAPFEYVLMIYSLFWGWQIFGEWPTLWVFAGAAVVISAGVYVFLREGRIKSGEA